MGEKGKPSSRLWIVLWFVAADLKISAVYYPWHPVETENREGEVGGFISSTPFFFTGVYFLSINC
jgi:hypothetical protein